MLSRVPRWGHSRLAVAAALSAVAIASPVAADEAPPWRSPTDGPPEVLRGFDPPRDPWGPGHRGIDLAAAVGESVYAAGAGRVGYAGMLAGRGVVTVVHGSLRTTYLPVAAGVRPGQRVERGAVLGTVEDRAQHCRPRTCLHWGLLRGEDYLNPLTLLGGGAVRLFPLWDGNHPGAAGDDPVPPAPAQAARETQQTPPGPLPSPTPAWGSPPTQTAAPADGSSKGSWTDTPGTLVASGTTAAGTSLGVVALAAVSTWLARRRRPP